MAKNKEKQTQGYLAHELEVGKYYKALQMFYMPEFCFQLIKKKKNKFVIQVLGEYSPCLADFSPHRRFIELNDEIKAGLL